jgi:hypothetical protein
MKPATVVTVEAPKAKVKANATKRKARHLALAVGAGSNRATYAQPPSPVPPIARLLSRKLAEQQCSMYVP